MSVATQRLAATSLAARNIRSIDDVLVARALTASADSIAAGRSHRALDAAPIRVMIVHSQRLVLLGLEALFERARHCQLVASSPDVAVLDADLSDSLARFAEPERVLLLADTVVPSAIVAAVRAGVHGYLIRQTDAPRLVDAVEIVAAGGWYISSTASEAVVE